NVHTFRGINGHNSSSSL
nr:Chain A, Peptide 38136 [Plasmodium falciparum]